MGREETSHLEKIRPLHPHLCAASIAPPESPDFIPDFFDSLEREAAHVQALGKVLIYGDLDARTGREKDFLTMDGNIYIVGAGVGDWL
ncbi:hypothetical protein GDO81_019595 [Engystomops pustulosus]|uniref:Uncharacterized protein n=1 Tax=Engystomops pustulosus TaxID=76066 RepID=A0AAV6YTN9_ENGPU|nr:hypothetical protein GDO81_019595 [Engystomops pustulosus]